MISSVLLNAVTFRRGNPRASFSVKPECRLNDREFAIEKDAERRTKISIAMTGM
jgi:hypothetical protein